MYRSSHPEPLVLAVSWTFRRYGVHQGLASGVGGSAVGLRTHGFGVLSRQDRRLVVGFERSCPTVLNSRGFYGVPYVSVAMLGFLRVYYGCTSL